MLHVVEYGAFCASPFGKNFEHVVSIFEHSYELIMFCVEMPSIVNAPGAFGIVLCRVISEENCACVFDKRQDGECRVIFDSEFNDVECGLIVEGGQGSDFLYFSFIGGFDFSEDVGGASDFGWYGREWACG